MFNINRVFIIKIEENTLFVIKREKNTLYTALREWKYTCIPGKLARLLARQPPHYAAEQVQAVHLLWRCLLTVSGL